MRASDVIRALERVIIEGDPERTQIRATVAAAAGVSVETVKRVMRGHWDTLDLDRADRLMVAIGAHISECEMVWID